jgi:AcrR family transcriptional regulator
VARQKHDITKRQAKAGRILDAATGLILRWGYNNTTMDDIARQAGIAKGTLYLYWKTREDLFRTLMVRERLKWTEDFLERVRGDAASITLRGMVKHSALSLMKRPLLKAALLQDMEVLGKLAYSEHSSAANQERLATFKTYLEVLRKHGLVRADLSLQAQAYTLSAVFMGFFVIAPMVPDEMLPSDNDIAELIAETVHRTLEIDHAVPSEQLQPLYTAYLEYLNSQLEIAQERFRQEFQ